MTGFIYGSAWYEVCCLGSVPLINETCDVCILLLAVCVRELLEQFQGSYSATENGGGKKRNRKSQRAATLPFQVRRRDSYKKCNRKSQRAATLPFQVRRKDS
jgi:hypothetical protein